MDCFDHAAARTFTYCKPLMIEPDNPPRELNRLTARTGPPRPARSKTTSSTLPATCRANRRIDNHGSGRRGRDRDDGRARRRGEIARRRPQLRILADSRRSARLSRSVSEDEPPAGRAFGADAPASVEQNENCRVGAAATRRDVFVTRGGRTAGRNARGPTGVLPALPLRGEIDIVGAGDAVTANLAAALAAGASLREALVLANAASSIVIHQLGTTGTASVRQLVETLGLSEK